MKIAFVHYHLKTGGVTTVLKRQIMAIRGACDALVMTGDRAAAQLPCKVVEIPELGYDHPGIAKPPPDRIVEQVLKVLREKWPADAMFCMSTTRPWPKTGNFSNH
jgi:hypothetical protein